MALGGTLLFTAGVTLVAVVLTFGIARARKRYDTVETFWGLGFAIVAVTAFPFGDGPLSLRLVVVLLTVVWGVRLSLHLHLRNHKLPEDPRYARMGHGPLKMFLRV